MVVFCEGADSKTLRLAQIELSLVKPLWELGIAWEDVSETFCELDITELEKIKSITDVKPPIGGRKENPLSSESLQKLEKALGIAKLRPKVRSMGFHWPTLKPKLLSEAGAPTPFTYM